MIFIAILMALWLLPTFVFVGAAMMAIPGSFVKHDVVPTMVVLASELAGTGDIGR